MKSGFAIENLRNAIAEQLDTPVYRAWEKFMPEENNKEGDSLLHAMGILKDM